MRHKDQEKLAKLSAFIMEYAHENNGATPTLPEITKYMGMSKSVAYRYIIELKENGMLEYSGKGTMRICANESFYRRYNSVKVPIYGSVICGTPEEERQYNEGYLALPEEWVNGDCFLLRAKGDSMIGVGVDDGDLLLVKKEVDAANGQRIIAITEDGNTFKTFFREADGRVRLHAENPIYEDFYPRQLAIQGIVLKVIKNMH